MWPTARSDPEPFTVRWERAPDDVVSAIASAARESAYVDPKREAWAFYRVGGATIGDFVSITLTPYVMPGFRAGRGAVPLRVEGTVRADGSGSALDGRLSACASRADYWLFIAVSVMWFAMTVPTGGLGMWLMLEAMAVAMFVAFVKWRLPAAAASESKHLPQVLRALVEQQGH